MSGNILERDQIILCVRSGNHCAMPDCRKILVIARTSNDRESLVAIMAHIKGEKPKSARYDSNMIDAERNAYSNLILICPSCHKKIDDQPNTYTVEKIFEKRGNKQGIALGYNNIANIYFNQG